VSKEGVSRSALGRRVREGESPVDESGLSPVRHQRFFLAVLTG